MREIVVRRSAIGMCYQRAVCNVDVIKANRVKWGWGAVGNWDYNEKAAIARKVRVKIHVSKS